MQSIGLVLALHNTQPPGTTGAEIRRAFERAYFPMLDALGDFPALRVSMHWSGQLLEWMELHSPDHLDRLLALVASGRVEPLGGLWGGGLVPALPERDVVGQVQAMSRWWKARADVKLRGAWLPYCGWDPSLARVLGRLGLQYTVLEESQFHPAIAPDGYHLTEREGTALALFAADTRLGRLVPDTPPGKILKAIALRAKEGARCLVLALPGEGFGAALDSSSTACFGGNRGWVRRFFQALVDNQHWLKQVGFGTVLDRMRPTDRAYPPASVSLPVALAALGGASGAAFWQLLSDARRGDDPTATRAAPFLRTAPWESLLVRHPEVNRLHKRMLRTSAEVWRLRSLLREARPSEGDPRLDSLEDATRALYRGQNASAYVLGVDVGAQDAGVRHNAWAELMRAEFAVATALGEAGKIRGEQVDYDCDGRAEVVVRTPHLSAIVAPSAGGALVELGAWAIPGNVLNVRTRREEAEHEEVKRGENLPRILPEPGLEDEAYAEIEITESYEDAADAVPEVTATDVRLVETGLAERLHYDRHVRASFLDHFLGPEATLSNVRNGRFPEAGDFCGADYQLLHFEETADQVVCGVARDGNVNEGAALRLVRILKRFAFNRESPVIDVRYEIANRYHEPVRARFALELNLCLDGLAGGELFLETPGGGLHSVTALGDLPDVGEVTLTDGNRGWRLTLKMQQPGHLWHFPIETVSRTPKGVGACFQGVCLMPWWPVELWGMERKRIDLTLTLEA
ncbi:MAG: alpha-amylase/4-alpha-glucanotransferase domain-containing protein [Myxococcota bacterium]